MKAIAAGIWTALCIGTIATGDVSVAQQAIAQGSLAVILLADYILND